MRNLPRIVADTPVGRAGAGGGLARRQGADPAGHRGRAAGRAAAGRGHARPPASRPTELAGLGLRVAPISPETRERFSLRPEQRAW